jgi:hypothetical protein
VLDKNKAELIELLLVGLATTHATLDKAKSEATHVELGEKDFSAGKLR